MRSLRQAFDTPVPAYSFAVFRIVFGIMVVIGGIMDLTIDDAYQLANHITPEFHAKYTYFEWIPDWPSLFVLDAFTAVTGLTGIFIALGLFYRPAILAFTALFTYAFLVDAAYYLNHYYFIALLAFLMVFIPANRVWALDAKRIKGNDGTVPGWCLWLFRAQIEIVLLYAGLVKIKSDWFALEPLGSMLRQSEGHVFGSLVYQDWFVALGAYGVVLLHVVGAPLLYFKRTRLWVFGIYCLFHFMNSYTFYIDFFPYVTILATTLFFAPDWPARVLARFKRVPYAPPTAVPAVPAGSVVTVLVLAWTALHVLLPLRGALYEGDTSWTREGQGFAWRMMLDSQKQYPAECIIQDKTAENIWRLDPATILTPRQYASVGLEPRSMVQFAKYIEERFRREKGLGDLLVKCQMPVSLNGREPQLLIDPETDLTKEDWGIAPESWILPLTKPFVHWKERTW